MTSARGWVSVQREESQCKDLTGNLLVLAPSVKTTVKKGSFDHLWFPFVLVVYIEQF